MGANGCIWVPETIAIIRFRLNVLARLKDAIVQGCRIFFSDMKNHFYMTIRQYTVRKAFRDHIFKGLCDSCARQ